MDTASGVYRAAWRYEGRRITVDVSVPFGGSALLELPQAGIREELSAGTYRYSYEESDRQCFCPDIQ